MRTRWACFGVIAGVALAETVSWLGIERPITYPSQVVFAWAFVVASAALNVWQDRK